MTTELEKHIAMKIRMLRISKNVSLKELSEGIGVAFQQCQKYEKGVNRISASRLYRIAEFMNIDISYFYDDFSHENKAILELYFMDISETKSEIMGLIEQKLNDCNFL